MTERQLQQILKLHWDKKPKTAYTRNNVFLNKWEADFIVIDYDMTIREIEIKTSLSDFKNEFKNKMAKHKIYKSPSAYMKKMYAHQVVPNYYYIACPAGIVTKDLLPKVAGLLWITGNKVLTVKRPTIIHPKKNPSNKFFFKLLKKHYR